MKQALITLLCCSSLTLFAQDGFFVQPGIGAGIANRSLSATPALNNYSQIVPPHYGNPAINTTGYNLFMHIGYTHHAWVLTSGLSLLRSGYKELYYSGDIPPGLKITEGVHFGHILLPLTLGYKKGLNDRWSLTPAIGAAASYNFSFIGDKYQYNEYKRTSAWAVANVVAGYKVNKHTTLTAGPEAQYMLTSLWGNTSINRKNTQNNYTILLNAGIIYTR